MTRQELLQRIRQCEAGCVAYDAFTVDVVQELAPGVIAAAIWGCGSGFVIYFDRGQAKLSAQGKPDVSEKIAYVIAADTGFIEDGRARCWRDIGDTAKQSLRKLDGEPCDWHAKRIEIPY